MTATNAGRTAKERKDWGDLLAEGRLARFALIMLGVWLNAADTLVTATIMPSVGEDLGGYAYFAWATAGFLVGAILAASSSGRLAEIAGLGRATALAGVLMTLGCVMSAAAPTVEVFLLGRLVQGLGSGWISGFSMVAIALLFPERHLARVFAAISAVWGIATVLGPLFGGVVVQSGDWRAVFWLFAAQSALFSAAAPFLMRGGPAEGGGPGVPWRQLTVIAMAVVAIAVADLVSRPTVSIALIVVGLAALGAVFWIDARAPVRLLPHRAGDIRTPVGAGYQAMFWMTAASMGFAIYGPPVLQQLRGYSPLVAGYVISVESFAWTFTALLVAHVEGVWDRRWVRIGALMLIASQPLLAVTLAEGWLGWVLVGGSLLGAAFGLSWNFVGRRVLGALSDEDRAIGSSAIMAVRQTGAAAGAAISGAAANLAGFHGGLNAQSAHGASLWVFAAGAPIALIGAWTAFRLTREG